MSRMFRAAVGLREIAVTVDDDWSGRALVGVRRYTSAGDLVSDAQATCDVRQLLLGVVDLVLAEVGEIGAHEWPMFVALAVRRHTQARLIACLAREANL
jgi:hypothetical protein